MEMNLYSFVELVDCINYNKMTKFLIFFVYFVIMSNSLDSKLTNQEKQDLLIKAVGQASAFKHLALPHRVSRLGTVVVLSNHSIIIPEDMQTSLSKNQPEIQNQLTINAQQSINYNIAPWVAWIILFASVFISALGPAWMSWDIKSQSFTRNSWRFFFQTVLHIPFLLYERRVTTVSTQHQLTKSYNILVIFKNSLQFAVFYFFFIISTKFTSINHAIYLSNTVIFWRLIFRMHDNYTNNLRDSKREEDQIHEFEKGGAGMMIISFLLIFFASVNDPVVENPPIKVYYLIHSRGVRLIGDLVAMFAGCLLTYMQRNSILVGDLPTPPLQTSLIYNGFISLSLSALGYFCGGSQISFNPLYGMFGMFTITNFVRIFYIAILLGMGIMLTNIFTNIIFPAVILSICGIVQPLISSCVLHFFDSQQIPSGFTCIGFSFMELGLLMIVAGRSAVLGIPIKFNFNLSVKKLE